MLETKKRKHIIQVVVVDDHPLMREGILSQLKRGSGIKVCGDVSNGAELLLLLPQTPVDVVLLDLQMPEMNGPQTLIQLRSDYPEIKVLVLSMFNEKRMIREMFRLGANGYVTKDVSTEELIDAIYNVYYRGYHTQNDSALSIYQEIQKEKSTQPTPIHTAQLKERDLLVLNLICQGLSSDEIAPRLNLSKFTIDLCRSRLISHFGAKNVVHLVAEAIRLGIYIPS
jgi:DNA-binding NarL/FixJ family response regulator